MFGPGSRFRFRLPFGLGSGAGPGLVSWNRWFGDRGERASARFLRRKGMRILQRGYRTTLGEIDLIARDGGTLVFVEVKTRRRGEPAEAVTPLKQRRITQAALHFLKRHGLLDAPRAVPCRFDIVAVVWPDGRGRPTIEHIPDAFEAVGPPGQFFR
jgi:putative endonuclease